ncbi:hypothetical protein L596_029307 [Steinernema carpocapsae]|uniref:Uncharacterized protein n=1 Tax=Steinernema carpocapsae TaxID=34508 RepID=A0A4U5LU91_STECR|nr:hypothetical protein L596_029307 [Steinernema carpocapsae]
MTIDAIDLSITICNLLVLPIFLPINIAVIWILKTKPEFKSRTAYTIILTIAVLDCTHMITTFMAGVMNLTPYCSCLRNGYLLAIPILEFILATNRFFIILRVRGNSTCTRLCKILVVLSASVPVPLLFLLSVVDENIFFSYHEATYRYKGPAYFESPYIYSRIVLEGSALSLYFLTVLVIVSQKGMYSSKITVSSREARLLAQALLQACPVAFTIFVGAYLFNEIWKHGVLFVFWSVTAITIPATHILILIAFNSLVRKHLRNMLPGASTKRLFALTAVKSASDRSRSDRHVTTIMTRTFVT